MGEQKCITLEKRKKQEFSSRRSIHVGIHYNKSLYDRKYFVDKYFYKLKTKHEKLRKYLILTKFV